MKGNEEMGKYYNKVFTIPNILTALRLVASSIMLLYMAQYGIAAHRAAFVLMTTGIALTDAADGFIARRFHMESRLGGILDPIADKFFNWGLGITLMAIGEMPLWPLLVGVRDVAVAIVTKNHLVETGKDLKPTLPAKVKMGFQSIGTVSTIAFGFGMSGASVIAPVMMGCAVLCAVPEVFTIRKKIKEDKEFLREQVHFQNVLDETKGDDVVAKKCEKVNDSQRVIQSERDDVSSKSLVESSFYSDSSVVEEVPKQMIRRRKK